MRSIPERLESEVLAVRCYIMYVFTFLKPFFTYLKKKVKERIVLREIHLRTTGRPLSMGSHSITCYIPDRGDRPAFTPTGQVGTRFIDLVRMKG